MSGGLSGTTRFLYDGDALVAEYDASGNMLRRYVHGQGADTPQVWFEGAGTSASVRRYLFTNHQGSVTAIADGNGNTIAINRYDEYGIPGAGNIGRFQYTGQAWLEDLGMYHYKARIYSPTLGRFLQTDPIGYEDQINLYAYVGNDPVNLSDPTGMASVGGCGSRIEGVNNCSGSSYFAYEGALAAHRAESANIMPEGIKKVGEALQSGKRKLDAAVDVATDTVDSVTYSLNELEEDIDMAVWGKDVPDEAYETLDQYKKQGYKWESFQSYYAHRYIDKKGDLPDGTYRTMYVRQFNRGRFFGPAPRDRLIVDPRTGAAYYTPDHYKTFIKMR